MRELQPEDRPREKLDRHGAAALGDNELLAVLIGHGSAGHDALHAANGVLALAGGVHGLLKLHPAQLRRQPGIGRAQASRIRAAVELGRRTLTSPPVPRPQFRSPRDLAQYLLPLFGAHAVEQLGVLLLDVRLRLLGVRLISVGSVDSSWAHPRDVFREAVLAGAANIVVFHNHPSGDPAPSRDDLALTARLKHAGIVVGVQLADHVILAETRYYSMKEQGLI
jgi:DNA repair protein RadC